jgi:hypothetical protein
VESGVPVTVLHGRRLGPCLQQMGQTGKRGKTGKRGEDTTAYVNEYTWSIHARQHMYTTRQNTPLQRATLAHATTHPRHRVSMIVDR